MRENTATKKLVMAGVLTALAVVGSLISFPHRGEQSARRYSTWSTSWQL